MAIPVEDNKSFREIAEEFEAQTGVPVLPSQRMKQAIQQVGQETWLDKLLWFFIAWNYYFMTGLVLLVRGKIPADWAKVGDRFNRKFVFKPFIVEQAKEEAEQKLQKTVPLTKEKKRGTGKAVTINP
jgi:hypothetical protein